MILSRFAAAFACLGLLVACLDVAHGTGWVYPALGLAAAAWFAGLAVWARRAAGRHSDPAQATRENPEEATGE